MHHTAVDSHPDSLPVQAGAGTVPVQNSKWIPIEEKPIFTGRKLRVVCVGAGYSGLMLAHKIKYLMKLEDIIDLCIYEKNHDVGGTWLENKYPGVAW